MEHTTKVQELFQEFLKDPTALHIAAGVSETTPHALETLLRYTFTAAFTNGLIVAATKLAK